MCGKKMRMADENVCTVSNKFTTTSINQHINVPRLLKVELWKKIRYSYL